MARSSFGQRARRRATRVAVHLRRLAEQQVHRHVDRPVAPARARAGARRRPSRRSSAVAWPTTANGQRSRAHIASNSATSVGGDAEHVALLRLVAPQLHRRQRRIVAGDLRQVDHAADVGVVQQFGNRVRQAAGADVVHDSGSGWPRRARRSGRSLPGSGAPSPGCRAAPRRNRAPRCSAPEATDEAAPPPRPISIAGPPSTTTASPGAQAELRHLLAVDRAEAAGEHDRLVVAARQAGLVGRQLEAAEVAGRGPAGRTRC